MNLVVGSTGMLGTEICRLLRADDKPVRAFTRTTSAAPKVEALRRMGADIVTGNLRDPASLAAATEGVSCVLVTASAIASFSPENTFSTADAGIRDLIDAARAAGVEQFIFVSVSSGLNAACDLIEYKRRNEQYLATSGVPYTILRPTMFMEAWLSPALGFDAANARVQVIGTGEGRVSYISMHDVARFCCESIGHPPARNAAFDLGGPDALSPLEVVAIFESLKGQRFNVTHVPLEALQAQYAAAGHALENTFAALMLESANGDVIPMQEIRRIFPAITLRSVDDYARRIVPLPAA